MIIKIENYDYYNLIENEYDHDFVGPVLVICGREEDGKFHRIRMICNEKLFKPHFFVEDNQINILKIKELGLDYEKWPHSAVYNEDEKVLKIFTTFPYQVSKLREYFEHTYNADIRYQLLAMMTLQLPNGFMRVPDNSDWVKRKDIKSVSEEEEFFVEPKIFYYDIETDFIDPSKKWDLDNQKIISMVVYDNYLNKYDTIEASEDNTGYWSEVREVKRHIKKPQVPEVSMEEIHHCVSEKEMLSKFFSLFKRRPSAWLGHNSHGGNNIKSFKSSSVREWDNGFDEPVIYKRALANGLVQEMQQMSPLPPIKNKYGRYYGVYKRGRGDKFEVVVRCLTPLDTYADVPKMGYIKDYRDFFGRGLNDYLRYFAKSGKISHEGLTVAELKEVDLEKELFYNRIDVEGCLFLDRFFGYSKDIFERITLFQVPGIDLLYSTKVHSFLTLKYSQDKCVYDTRWQNWSRNSWQGWLQEKKEEYGIVMKKTDRAGGFNVEMQRGGQGWTVNFDFSGLYPNLLISSNAGPDTLVSVKSETDTHFIDFRGKEILKSDCNITPSAPFLKARIKESIDVQIWKMLLGYRKLLKDRLKKEFEKNRDTESVIYKSLEAKQYNLKQGAINNKFGSSGNKGYLGFSLPVYNVAPSMSQPLVRGIVEEFLPLHGLGARGGDTDSVFVKLKGIWNLEDAIKLSDELAISMNSFIERKMKDLYNIDPEDNTVRIGWEKIGPFFYGHKKKNYLLDVWAQDGKILPVNKRYIMYKGFQLKKKDRSDITEKVQKVYFKLARKVTEENLSYSKTMGDFIKRIWEIFPFLSWEKICARINLKRKPEDYSKNFLNRRAADFSNERFETNFTNGSHGYIGYIKEYVRRKKKTVMMFRKEDILKIRNLGFDLDYKLHGQKCVKDKIDYLFEDYGTNWNKLEAKGSVSSMLVL